jgi:hypothetical protein
VTSDSESDTRKSNRTDDGVGRNRTTSSSEK